MLKTAIIGYGKMGKAIKAMAKENGLDIVSIIDPSCEGVDFCDINEESLKDAEVCIDFSHPESAMVNAEKIAKLGRNIVMGTTGWYPEMERMKNIVEKNNIGMIWSGNFSVGVNIFFRIVKKAAQIANNVENYDVFSYELHHNKKADSPSGTANMIAKILVEEIDRKKNIVYDKLDRQIKPDELHMASVRGGSIPGIHVVGLDSSADTIELKHTARNREGFAMGSIMAAKWIKGKKGFFNIDDMMDDVIGGAK